MSSNFSEKLGIKRSDRDDGGLDNLFDYSADEVETTRRVEVIDNPLLNPLSEYQRYMDASHDNQEYEPNKILLPEEIDAFVKTFHSEYEKNPLKFSDFLDKIVVVSYNDGNNNFHLNFSSYNKPDMIFMWEIATKERPLELEIEGNLGIKCFERAEYFNVKINGDIESNFAEGSKNLDIVINGNVKDNFGYCSTNLNVTINGDTKLYFGYLSNNLNAIINGNVGGAFSHYSNDLSAIINGNAGPDFGGGLRSNIFVSGDVNTKGTTFSNYNSTIKTSNKITLAKFVSYLSQSQNHFFVLKENWSKYSLTNFPSKTYSSLIFVDEKGDENTIARFKIK